MRGLSRQGFVLGITMVLGMGCGNDSGSFDDFGAEDTRGTTGTGGTGGDTTEPPPANGACHGVDGNSASMVTDQLGSQLPTLSGGSIADGTYRLTRYEWFDRGSKLHQRKIVMVVTQNGRTAKYYWMRGADPEERQTTTIATSGSGIAMRGLCPAGHDLEWDRFSVNGNELVLFSTRDAKAATFTRQ